MKEFKYNEAIAIEQLQKTATKVATDPKEIADKATAKCLLNNYFKVYTPNEEIDGNY